MIERLHPGVYVVEVPTETRPIEGVSMSTDRAGGSAAHRAHGAAPDWTQHNQSDPGVTLMQLFGFLSESLLFRANAIPEHLARMQLGSGVADGLAVNPSDSGETPQVHVSPGWAVTADGRPIDTDPS
jgi:hypothetical protein